MAEATIDAPGRTMKKYRTFVPGHRGLLLSIIWRAAKDLSSPDSKIRTDAEAYFQSSAYRYHLDLLNLPHVMPAEYDLQDRASEPF
jgi:hypothetical protein